MAYSKDKYQLTHLLQDAWFKLGQMKRWKITGGSQTTVINTHWAGVEEQIYEDDDAALVYGTVVVIEDAGGAGAAPEGEFGMITDYDSSSQTITMDSLTTAVAAGDKIGIASPVFPLQDMIEAANVAIAKLGEITVPDTSLTIVAGQTEYTLPSTIRRRPLGVNIQSFPASGDNGWVPVVGWNVVPASSGSDWTLIIPDTLTQGHSLQALYSAPHPN